MLPHERSLVERLKDKPFALIGVNSDSDYKAGKERVSKDQDVQDPAPWRHFADGSGGPIASRWNVHSYPTLFLLDSQGKIRQKFVGGPDEAELDKLVDGLVDEAKVAKPAGKNEPAKKSDKPTDKKDKKKGGP